MNSYQFYAERKKLPPVATRIITGNQSFMVASNGKNVIIGSMEVPPDFWNVKSKS